MNTETQKDTERERKQKMKLQSGKSLTLQSLRPKSHLLYGEDTAAVPPPELTETCGRRRVSEVASGWPYAVWLYFTIGSPWNYSAEL